PALLLPLLASRAQRVIAALASSDRKRAEQAEEVVDLAHDAILVRDLTPAGGGAIRFWNRGAERLYGYTAGEAVGRDARQLLRTHVSGGTVEDVLAAVGASGLWQGELVHTCKDGRSVLVDSLWCTQHRLEGQVAIEINRDISEIRRAQVLAA